MLDVSSSRETVAKFKAGWERCRAANAEQTPIESLRQAWLGGGDDAQVMRFLEAIYVDGSAVASIAFVPRLTARRAIRFATECTWAFGGQTSFGEHRTFVVREMDIERYWH